MKVECTDDRGLPCHACGGAGYVKTYNHADPKAMPVGGGSKWSIIPCVNYKPPVFVKPPQQSWDKIWMDLATNIASRSTCQVPNRNVGCVIISNDNTKVLALGYNGSAKGDDNSCEYEGDHTPMIGSSRCTCVHAEMNALTKLDTSNPCYKKMYLTLSPCEICYKLIVNANINEIIYFEGYKLEILSKLEKLGVKVRIYL